MKKLPLLIVFLLLSAMLFSQATDTLFKKNWALIDTLVIGKNLPKSALDKVNVLYTKAVQQNKPVQEIKALIYKMSLEQKVQETDINKSQLFLQQETEKAINISQKSILQVLQAQQLYRYYNNNRYQFYRRSKTANYVKADIATWSNDDFHKAITGLYHAALQPAAILKQTDLQPYHAIIIKGTAPKLHPTLYDLLAHIALDYFKTGDAYLSKPAYAFTISEPQALSSAKDFIAYTFTSADSLSQQLLALQLFQQLIKFHIKDADPAAFIDVDIERISWVNDIAVMDNKDALYRQALNGIANTYPANPIAAQANYLLAQSEVEKAATYQPLGDTANRYSYITAKQMIDKRLAVNDSLNEGRSNMQQLLAAITAKEMNTQVEHVNIPGESFRMYVEYKNVDTLFGRIIRLNTLKNLPVNSYDKKYWKTITQLNPYSTFNQPLPVTADYQRHSVEIKINALPAGKYLLIACSGKGFRDTADKLVAQYFDVSNISYIKNGLDYFALNRETGQPLKNIKVKIEARYYDSKSSKWVDKNFDIKTPDNNGRFSLPELKTEENNIQFSLQLFGKADTLNLGQEEYYNPRSNNYNDEDDDDEDDTDAEYESENARAYFFTDRSIYRPGQTVFFKGIAITKDRSTKKAKLYHLKDSATVYLHDANSQKIDSLKVKPNNFGSFSGKFKLPENLLNGEFSIDTKEITDGEVNFNVEEYKRPNFYVTFDTLKSSYRINDTIKITGCAKAYAGNTVDGAKVAYTIQREARFPYTWLFWRMPRPASSAQQIADSTVTTDADGRFEMSFIARPDSSIKKNTEPVFDFQVEASVTDINGETREQKTTVSVGYKSLVLQLTVPEIADAAAFKNMYVTTQNLSGQNVPAKVDLHIYPLETPAQLTRKRYWPAADQFVMSRAEYRQYFPYDEYDAGNDYHSWPRKEAIENETIHTDTSSKFVIQHSPLTQGWYAVEAITKDKDGQEVKEIKYIQLYDLNTSSLPSPQYNWSKVISNSAKPGDTARMIMGTDAKNVFVIQHKSQPVTDKKAGDNNYTFFTVDNTKKQIVLPVTEADRGGTGVYYAFVQHNRFYTGGMNVFVGYDAKNLQISYETYRNKTQPGSPEKWTIKITGDKGEKAAAELLTGMYDASLDQFKKQQWEVPDILPKTNFTNNDWDGILGFETRQSFQNNIINSINFFDKIYDRLATNGNDFWMTVNDDNGYSSITGGVKKQGKVAGIAMRQDAAPGLEASSIRIRGAATMNDVVVTGYGTNKKSISASINAFSSKLNIQEASVKLRGLLNVDNLTTVLVVIDGVVSEKKVSELSMDDIDYMNTLKGGEATALYGAKAANGVVIVTTKEYTARNKKKKEEDQPVQIRKNFNETAFFFPALYADTAGNYSFSFTMPEALTQWKWMSFAHTQDLAFGYSERSVTTQKTLMLQPNNPRFLREGDQVELSAKITNLNDSESTGRASLQLVDAITNQPVDGLFQNVFADQYFTSGAGKSASVKFPVTIPFNYNKPVIIRMVARLTSGNVANASSDGEEIALPVLTNRMLVTETLPIQVKGDTTQHFSFTRLLNTAQNEGSANNVSLTVEYTANPVWYAVQSLPYLIEFPYECAEQTFNRFYANALAADIVNKHPKIKTVFEQWQKDTAHRGGLNSNEELKQLLLQETPWVLEAENEAQQQKNIALLFDVVKMQSGLQSAIEKLQQMQLDNGGFCWFKGGRADRYITQYIVTGIGRLIRLNALPKNLSEKLDDMLGKALIYIDKEAQDEYAELVKSKADFTKNQLSPLMIHYWYARSFFMDKNRAAIADKIFTFYSNQSSKYWMQQSTYLQGLMAVTTNRFMPHAKNNKTNKNTAVDIMRSLKENAVEDTDAGMYWKNNNSGYYWYQSPIETQALLIEAFNEVMHDKKSVDNMQTWLLRQKQTNNWKTTKATADACYALLLNNTLEVNRQTTITLGNVVVGATQQTPAEAGSGYFKTKIEAAKITPAMGNITVTTTSDSHSKEGISWGSVYWQYFEDLDKITAAVTPLSVTKQLFVEHNSPQGKQLTPVLENDELKVGDKIVVRLVLKSSRDMEYLHVKDMRAATMEPVNVLSGYKYQDGLGYYEATKDASTNFFISNLNKGTYVFEYPLHITHAGTFSVGVANAQCMYAPEFSSHSEGIKIRVAGN